MMRNIGIAHAALGETHDAIQSFEAVMETAPDYRSGSA